MAAGSDAVFLETHPEPSRAKSDAGSQLPLEAFRPLVESLARYRNLFLEENA